MSLQNADARLAAAHGDGDDLNGLAAEGLVAAARGAPAGDVAPPSIARVVVAPAPDAQRVRDVQVAALAGGGAVADAHSGHAETSGKQAAAVRKRSIVVRMIKSNTANCRG
jgi:hypothetical protein